MIALPQECSSGPYQLPWLPDQKLDFEALRNMNKTGLHFSVRETYRDAMLRGLSQQRAFDLSAALVSERHPGLPPDEVRTRVARMLAYEPRQAP